jgi:general secretion pathway protein E
MMRIDRDGLTYRPRFAVRPRLLRWDDLTTVEGDTLVARDGTRLRLPDPLREQVLRVMNGPPTTGPLPALGRALAGYLEGPHGPRIAARALIAAAGTSGATDVHMESSPAGAVIRFRIEGDLAAFCEVPRDAAAALGAALKGLAGCLPYRSDIGQEGRIQRDGVCTDVRASFVPTAVGERVALRLFGRLFLLDELGLPVPVLHEVRSVLAARTGLVLVAGAAGAGKTTTLYAALAHVASTRRGAHLSLEDPVEQRLRVAGIPVDQIELAPERGLTAEAMLVAILRQDVDVLGVGEIRTPAEARLALEAAHTGRLVLAGLHAGSAEEARRRMRDLGVEEAVLDATLRAVLYQKLVGRPCACGLSADCARCRGLGTRRVLHAEIAVTAHDATVRGVA